MPAITNQNDWDHIFFISTIVPLCPAFMRSLAGVSISKKKNHMFTATIRHNKNMCYKKREIECEKLSSLSALPRLCSVIRI